MSLQAFEMKDRMDPLEHMPVDGLIESCFDRAFLAFNLFIEDARTCLDHSEAVFRELAGHDTATEADFYTRLVAHLRDLPHCEAALPGVDPASLMCWLLKDSADLSYDEIGAAVSLQRAEVARRISEVRLTLLG